MSQWSDLNRRPTPSLTPPLHLFERARLYLFHFKMETLVSRSGLRQLTDATVLSLDFVQDFNRNSGFAPTLLSEWAGSCVPPWSCSTS